MAETEFDDYESVRTLKMLLAQVAEKELLLSQLPVLHTGKEPRLVMSEGLKRLYVLLRRLTLASKQSQEEWAHGPGTEILKIIVHAHFDHQLLVELKGDRSGEPFNVYRGGKLASAGYEGK